MPKGYQVPRDTRGPCPDEACGSPACESARAIVASPCSECGRVIGRDRPMLFARFGLGALVVRHEDCDATEVR